MVLHHSNGRFCFGYHIHERKLPTIYWYCPAHLLHLVCFSFPRREGHRERGTFLEAAQAFGSLREPFIQEHCSVSIRNHWIVRLGVSDTGT